MYDICHFFLKLLFFGVEWLVFDLIEDEAGILGSIFTRIVFTVVFVDRGIRREKYSIVKQIVAKFVEQISEAMMQRTVFEWTHFYRQNSVDVVLNTFEIIEPCFGRRVDETNLAADVMSVALYTEMYDIKCRRLMRINAENQHKEIGLKKMLPGLLSRNGML